MKSMLFDQFVRFFFKYKIFNFETRLKALDEMNRSMETANGMLRKPENGMLDLS